MKKFLAVLGSLIMLPIVVATLITHKNPMSLLHRAPVTAAPATQTPATQTTLIPSPQFFADLAGYEALVNRYSDAVKALSSIPQVQQVQSLQDQVTGAQTRLSREVPQGYHYDSKTRMFVKN